MKIAICVTTKDRRAMFRMCVARILFKMPREIGVVPKLFVIDDASLLTNGMTDYRFDTQVGIPRAKNKCLELAYEWGADHVFLFDDDTYPIADDWWKPYVEHPEPHLMYQFKLHGKPKSDMRELYRDENTVAYSHTRGAMIYLERRVLDVVGGFDEAYGLGGFEHPDFTNRIHNAGLTTHRAMDVPNSDKLLYCLDQDGQVESTLKGRGNYSLYKKNRDSKAYKEFRS